ncbi:metalloregulator ArsR/SmtB family transcription factor [Pseudoduganella eburnea]|uniref:Metalloregulator ArsR/SmtB family transcription factor n=2 Tax=Massilia eburnea TaxID=1776165 RepID=A0A6L6QLU1_9BURK|nr:metalloregulator ArsR/SmtB family transcription factor [Massilia eburnea]
MKSRVARGEQADRIFAALGDGTRRAIVDLLAHGPLTVSALAQPLGVSLTAVAQHLQILEACGLLKTEKRGRVRFCAMDPDGLDALEEWVGRHRQLWARRFSQLEEILREDP